MFGTGHGDILAEGTRTSAYHRRKKARKNTPPLSVGRVKCQKRLSAYQ